MLFLAAHAAFAYDQTSTDFGGHVGYRIADFKSDHAAYPIWYKITNGTVVGTPLDLPAKALIFMINATNDGELTVELPRSIIDSKNQSMDKPYFVAVGGITTGLSKIHASETSDNYIRILKINFAKNTSEIEIVGTFFVEKYQTGTKTSSMLLSPLKQFKENKDAYSVGCKQNLLLVVSKSNIPACVKEATATKLWNRGWVNKSTDIYAKYASPDILEKFQSEIISSKKAIQIVQDYVKENNIKLGVNTTSPGFKIVTSLNYEVPSSIYNNLLDVNPKTGIPTQIFEPLTPYYKNPQWWAELEKYYLGMDSHRIEDGNLVWHVDYRDCMMCIAPYPIFMVDAITGKVVLTPNGIPEKIPIEEKNKTSSALKLSLSIDNQYANPAQPISIDMSLNNTSSTQLTLNREDNWPRDDLSSGPCSNLPFGMAILKGYYTEQNMSQANSLVIFQPIPCPLPLKIKSYTFQPLSSKATQECDSLFSCTGPVDMKTHLEVGGFVANNDPHHTFTVGTYTIVAGDQWGHIAIQHFTEAFATALNVTHSVFPHSQNSTSNFTINSGSGSITLTPSCPICTPEYFNETRTYTGNVGKIIPGYPVLVKISDPYTMSPRTDKIPASEILPNGTFHYTITVTGKFGRNQYTLNFIYGNQSLIETLPVLPP